MEVKDKLYKETDRIYLACFSLQASAKMDVTGLIFSDVYKTSKDRQISITLCYRHTCTVNAQNHLNRDLTSVNGICIITFDYLTILNIRYQSVTKDLQSYLPDGKLECLRLRLSKHVKTLLQDTLEARDSVSSATTTPTQHCNPSSSFLGENQMSQ